MTEVGIAGMMTILLVAALALAEPVYVLELPVLVYPTAKPFPRPKPVRESIPYLSSIPRR